MEFPRSSGILLHPTSLPGRFGIGDLGNDAYKFADFLAETGQHYWQILPLGPTGYGNSQFSCLSIFAGNPILISLDKLVTDNLLSANDLVDVPKFPENIVDYDKVTQYKTTLYKKSYDNFAQRINYANEEMYKSFVNQNSWWLEDYSLFMSLKEINGFTSWNKWEDKLKWRLPAYLDNWKNKLENSINYYKYLQFIFYKQWYDLKKYCTQMKILFIGDIPIFINLDSDAVWSNPELFSLDKNGNPTVVAGVPPDYFSETGQLWGNPLYKWQEMKKNHFSWWINRFKHILMLVDIVRIDHFRGFESYWEVPYTENTAINGRWVKGPGSILFETVQKSLGNLPVIAEDLGDITQDVKNLRDNLGFPGMRVLQFAFDNSVKNDHKPFNYIRNCVVFTGTHDNNTTVGWFTDSDKNNTLSNEQRDMERYFVKRYLGTDGTEINWDFIRLALSSVADTAIIPLQDILGLGSESRMNIPGMDKGNWSWRFNWNQVTNTNKKRLKDMMEIYGRLL
jgi:4-alpha-glucanotransferase